MVVLFLHCLHRNKYFIDPLYFPQPFTNPSSRFPSGEKLRKCQEIFKKIVMGNLGMSGDFFFKSPEHPDFVIESIYAFPIVNNV